VEHFLQQRVTLLRIGLVAGNLPDGHRAENVFQLTTEQRRLVEWNWKFGHALWAWLLKDPEKRCAPRKRQAQTRGRLQAEDKPQQFIHRSRRNAMTSFGQIENLVLAHRLK